MSGRRANTIANEKRYSASGITHSSGIGRMTVVKYEVTASIQVEGMAASTTQRARRRHVMGLSSMAVGGSGRAGASATGTTVPFQRAQATVSRQRRTRTR